MLLRDGMGGWVARGARAEGKLGQKLGQLLLLRARERQRPAQATSDLPSQKPQASPDKAPPPPRRLSRSNGEWRRQALGAWQRFPVIEHPAAQSPRRQKSWKNHVTRVQSHSPGWLRSVRGCARQHSPPISSLAFESWTNNPSRK